MHNCANLCRRLALIALMGAGPAAAQTAPDAEAAPPAELRFACGYVQAPDGIWWLQCTDLTDRLIRSQLLGTAPRPEFWFVPIFSLPFEDAGAVQLVRAVLCRPHSCAVAMAPVPR